MDREAVLDAGAQWMRMRAWRGRLAKRRHYQQSLFEHSLIELDVLLELLPLPILATPKHYGLSEAEQKTLAVAVLARWVRRKHASGAGVREILGGSGQRLGEVENAVGPNAAGPSTTMVGRNGSTAMMYGLSVSAHPLEPVRP